MIYRLHHSRFITSVHNGRGLRDGVNTPGDQGYLSPAGDRRPRAILVVFILMPAGWLSTLTFRGKSEAKRG